jgi:CII-binding regulator of phage lambda lysogenization HflD
MAKEPVKAVSQNSDPVLTFRIIGAVQVQEKLMMYTVSDIFVVVLSFFRKRIVVTMKKFAFLKTLFNSF